MRELLLFLIVGALCPVAILRPRWGLYAYTWFALMRPDYLAWVPGDHPFSFALAVCTMIGGLVYLDRIPRLFKNPISLILIALQVPMLLSAVMAVRSDLAWPVYNMYARVLVMALLIPMLLDTVEHLREFFLVVAFSMGFLGAKFGLGGILHGGTRFDSGYGGFLADNNCVALAFAMVIPLCWYARSVVKAVWAKSMFLIMVFGSMGGVVWTHSRGGALSAGIVLLGLARRSRHKVLVLVLLVALAAPAVYLVRQTYIDRIASIDDIHSDSSIRERFVYWGAALRMWKDHPLFGVGFGSTNFQALLDRYIARDDNHVVHNTYLQVLVDSGLFAFLLYDLLLVTTWVWLGKSARRMRQTHPELEAYPAALQGGILAFAIGSMFLSRVTFDFYYILVATAAAWYLIEKQISVEGAEQTAPVPAVPVIAVPARLGQRVSLVRR